MKGKIFMTIFALPFFGTGVWMLYSVSTTIYDAFLMQDWVQVERLVEGSHRRDIMLYTQR